MRTRACAFLLCFAALATLSGCAEVGTVDAISGDLSEHDAFRKAERQDTSASWSAFLQEYPQSSHRQRATDGLNAALWREAQALNTAGAYIAFVRANPDNPNADAAASACKSLLLQAQGAEQDFADYFAMRPQDPDSGALYKALAAVRYAAAKSAGDVKSYAMFVSQYPGSEEAGELLPAMHSAAYAEAKQINTRLAYQFFLKRYPDAAEAADARDALSGFPSPVVQGGSVAELDRLLSVLRKASPYLVQKECYAILSYRLREQKDLYTAQAEELRSGLRQLDGGEIPQACSGQQLAVVHSRRQLVSNAVQSLAKLLQQEQYISSLVSDSKHIADQSAIIEEKASDMADSSEGAELEIEALYGPSPADSLHPEETASRNAKEAVLRARSAQKLASRGGQAQGNISDVMAAAGRQANLLMDIIASYEKPVGTAEE
jgi:hypothetical protein